MRLNFIIKGTLFPFDVMVSINQSNEMLLKDLKRCGINDDIAATELLAMKGNGRTCVFKGNQVAMRMNYLLKKSDMIGLVAHESLHAVAFIMERVGIKFKLFTSDEVYAYLLGHIVSEISKKIKI